jgi:hypothetical protein
MGGETMMFITYFHPNRGIGLLGASVPGFFVVRSKLGRSPQNARA